MKITFQVWCKDKNEWEKDDMFLLENGDLMEVKTGHIVNSKTHKVYITLNDTE